jgi:hypothetical protein
MDAVPGAIFSGSFFLEPARRNSVKKICYSPSPSFGKQSSRFWYVVIVPPIGPLAAATSAASAISGVFSTLGSFSCVMFCVSPF